MNLKKVKADMRIVLGIEYDGSHYHGWQRQSGLYTIQGCIEQALSKVANEAITVYCAGRTDTGVHAIGQIIHFNTSAKRSLRAWIFGVNSHLPRDISVHWSQWVDETFHARYSALTRRYCYVIYNHAIRPAILRTHVAWHYKALDDQLMHEAAQYLIGEYDFTSFRAMECQSHSPVRRIEQFTVRRQGHYIILEVTANAFLHHMVRNMTGVLMAIGAKRRPVEWIKEVLGAKNRSLGAETAPPYGLYLAEVTYPQRYKIPVMPMVPFTFSL